MKVRAVKDIVDIVEGMMWCVCENAEFELPEGVDWLSKGSVVPVREKKIETAVREPQERAVTR